MAIALASKTNTIPPSAAYPYGDIRDNDGTNNGTPVDRAVYADFHQFFARLLAEAGITANGLPDNLPNTFQYYLALLELTDRYRCTSASSVAIGFGLKTFTVPANMDFFIGTYLRISDANNPGTNFVNGFVVSYSGTTLVLFVNALVGAGTIANWIISLSAPIQATLADINAGSQNGLFISPAAFSSYVNQPWTLRANVADITVIGGSGTTVTSSNIKYRIEGKTMHLSFNFQVNNTTAPTDFLILLPASKVHNQGFALNIPVVIFDGGQQKQGKGLLSLLDTNKIIISLALGESFTNTTISQASGNCTIEIA